MPVIALLTAVACTCAELADAMPAPMRPGWDELVWSRLALCCTKAAATAFTGCNAYQQAHRSELLPGSLPGAAFSLPSARRMCMRSCPYGQYTFGARREASRMRQKAGPAACSASAQPTTTRWRRARVSATFRRCESPAKKALLLPVTTVVRMMMSFSWPCKGTGCASNLRLDTSSQSRIDERRMLASRAARDHLLSSQNGPCSDCKCTVIDAQHKSVPGRSRPSRPAGNTRHRPLLNRPAPAPGRPLLRS